MKLIKLSDNMIYDIEAGIQYTRRFHLNSNKITVTHLYVMGIGGGEDRGLDIAKEEAETLWRYLEAAAVKEIS
jgi:hypothetical protein